MQRRLVLEFTKMSGAGNDFLVVDNRFYYFSDEELAGLARRFCPRRVGVGADGLLALAQAEDSAHHYRMRYLNADGSIGTMCGNGARCLARYARNAGIEGEEMVFESDAGLYRVRVPAEAGAPVRLFVPPPRGFAEARAVHEEAGAAHFIWTGTEHAVCFVDGVEAAPVERWGPALRRHPAFEPAGANINFVAVVDAGDGGRARLRVRTFEKGVEAETLACGTGAMASALVAHRLGRVEARTVDVDMPGGRLTVGFAEDGADLYLEGPAVTVYRGTLEV